MYMMELMGLGVKLLIYNLIYLTEKYIQGDMFDRFGRKCLYESNLLEYNLFSIKDIDEKLKGKSLIMGLPLHPVMKNHKKIKKLLSQKDFILVIPIEHEAVHDLQLNWIYKNISANN